MSLPKIEIVTAGSAKTVVLPWFAGEKDEKSKSKEPQPEFAGKKNKDVDALASRLSESAHFGGKKNEASLLRFYGYGKAENTLLVGAGPRKKVTSESMRQLGATILLAQKREHLDWATLSAEGLLEAADGKDRAYWLQALCEGYLLAGYEFSDLKKKQDKSFKLEGLQIEASKADGLKEAAERAAVLAASVIFARGLGDRPGNYLTPTILGDLVKKMAGEAKLKCQILGPSEIQKEKMGLLWGVAKGSEEEPRFIILEYKGGGKEKPVVLVGKGITFDSGGISLKPPSKMEDMKYDMMGAAAVAGIMRSIGMLKPKLNIIGVIPSCENMPDGRAQKPGDVATSRSGKTVEIINTDAEGRLILADALEYVQDKFEPQAIVDFATLTGAVIDALGTVTSGIMGNHRELLERIKQASDLTSERVWELPLYEEYEEDLKSNVADIKNSGIREAGSSKGGTFLKFFVDKKMPWVHCDIAGTSYHRKDVNYHPAKYGAGVMVRLITHLLLGWKPLEK